MRSRITGSILLILGTCVGAGMLALPVVVATQNYPAVIFYLFLAWFLMTAGAFSILEVNLWLPEKSNIISMAKSTLGAPGQAVAWIVYLLLLYSLLCAYLSGMGGVLQAVVQRSGYEMPHVLATFLALLILGTVVYRGTFMVDWVNRLFVLVKFASYAALVLLLMPHVHSTYLMQGDFHWDNAIFLVMITSFGYAIIVPSLRQYLSSNTGSLRWALWFGGLLPLLVYVLWILVVKGVLSSTGGVHSLSAIAAETNTNKALLSALQISAGSTFLDFFATVFMFVCVMTSFLGVALSLVDFLADGFKVDKTKLKNSWIYILTFAPAFLVVVFYPGIFVMALQYAGLFCIILLLVMPLMMVYMGRYHKGFKGETILPCGKFVLLFIILCSLALLIDVTGMSFHWWH